MLDGGGDVAERRRTQRGAWELAARELGTRGCGSAEAGGAGSAQGLELQVDVAELVPGQSLLVEHVEEWIRVEVLHVPYTRLAP